MDNENLANKPTENKPVTEPVASKEPAEPKGPAEAKEPTAQPKTTRREKKPEKSGKSKAPIIVCVIGVIALFAGLIVMLLNLFAKPGVRDAEYLVKVGTWTLEGEPGVEWTFTEVGKGRLTTNAHTNDYDFIWAIEGDELKIETDWLYDLENEFTYKLDQGSNKLTLTTGDKTVTFAAKTAE